MTKKEFKERCSFHEYGKGQTKRNAIYFDWKTDFDNDVNIVGYKYMVKARVENCKKAELFNTFYKWVIESVTIPWWVEYRYAETDQKRFKVSIMG